MHMSDILHRVGIAAPIEKVYQTLTTLEGNRGWWDSCPVEQRSCSRARSAELWRGEPGSRPRGARMKLRVQIDHSRCLASASFVGLAPEFFASADDGRALVRLRTGAFSASGILDELSIAQANQIREAAMFCPPEAISVTDDTRGEQFFP
jgi:ferredoxin